MVLTSEQTKQFEELSRPLIKFLNEEFDGYPYTSIIITPTDAQLFEKSYSTGQIMDYVKD